MKVKRYTDCGMINVETAEREDGGDGNTIYVKASDYEETVNRLTNLLMAAFEIIDDIDIPIRPNMVDRAEEWLDRITYELGPFPNWELRDELGSQAKT